MKPRSGGIRIYLIRISPLKWGAFWRLNRKNILKLKTDQVPPEKALDVYDFTVKDMFKRQIQSIDPGAQLLEFRFEDPQKVEDNLKLLKEKMKELELL